MVQFQSKGLRSGKADGSGSGPSLSPITSPEAGEDPCPRLKAVGKREEILLSSSCYSN